jgi:hypothetical protein
MVVKPETERVVAEKTVISPAILVGVIACCRSQETGLKYV